MQLVKGKRGPGDGAEGLEVGKAGLADHRGWVGIARTAGYPDGVNYTGALPSTTPTGTLGRPKNPHHGKQTAFFEENDRTSPLG